MSLPEIFLILCASWIILFTKTNAYSKYGRSCKDIGCLNNEVCIMKEDPCTYTSNECGRYPTCERANSLSCSNFDCPPGQQCHLENGQPRCVSSRNVASHVPHSNSDNPSAPLYPGLQPDGTTSRPRNGAVLPSGPGYMGGQPGSGYPGSNTGSAYPNGNRGSNYPTGNTGGSQYPYGGGYPNQGYPNQGYPSQGGYPNQGYGGYQGGYPNQGYNGQPGYGGQQQYGTRYGNQPPPTRGTGNSFTDQITNGLKVAAGNALKDYLSKQIQKQFQG